MNTATDPLVEIQARLRRVERHNRILLTLCAGIAGLVLFTAAEDNHAQSEVRAHRFVLVSDKDKPTAYWASTNGYPVMVFTGTNVVQRPEDSPVYLAGSPDGVVLYLNGPSPGPESTITLAAGGNSYFSMASPDRAIFEVSPTGATQISYRRVDNGELDSVFVLQNGGLGLYNLPLSFYTGQTNLVLQLP